MRASGLELNSISLYKVELFETKMPDFIFWIRTPGQTSGTDEVWSEAEQGRTTFQISSSID